MVHRGANLIVPGLGHLMAKRYLAGTIFMALSLAGFALFATGIISIFAQYVAALKAELDDIPPAAFTTGRLLLEAGFGVVVVLVTYLWAWIDMGRGRQPADPPADNRQSGS